MTKVRLVDTKGTHFDVIVLVPPAHVPKVIRFQSCLFVYYRTQRGKPVFRETDFIDAITEEQWEEAKQNGLVT